MAAHKPLRRKRRARSTEKEQASNQTHAANKKTENDQATNLQNAAEKNQVHILFLIALISVVSQVSPTLAIFLTLVSWGAVLTGRLP